MKFKKYLLGIMLSSLILVPATSAFASDKGVKGEMTIAGNTTHKGTTSVANALLESKKAVGPGNAGIDVFKVVPIGSLMMDADWTLNSSSGVITYINVQVVFDDGTVRPFRRNTWTGVERDSAQNTYDEEGEHSATFSGSGLVNGFISFTCKPVSDSCFVYD